MTATTAHFINDLASKCHAMSVEKGFYDSAPVVGQAGYLEYDAMKLALMHSELSEALEELRHGFSPEYLYYRGKDRETGREYVTTDSTSEDGELLKPEGVPAELADVVIRIFDYAAFRDIDLGKAIEDKVSFNACRPVRHGKEF